MCMHAATPCVNSVTYFLAASKLTNEMLLTGVVQELSAHLVLPKDSHAGDIGQTHVSWSAADAENTGDEDGKLELLQYNVSWTNSDDGSHGEMCLEPHVHKCTIPAKHPK